MDRTIRRSVLCTFTKFALGVIFLVRRLFLFTVLFLPKELLESFSVTKERTFNRLVALGL